MNYKDFTKWLGEQDDFTYFILRWTNLMDDGVELAMDLTEFSKMFRRLREVVQDLNERADSDDYLLVGYESKVSRFKLSLYVCNGVDVDNVYTLVVKKK